MNGHARARKRPCRICRRWFRPDPRESETRQRACGNRECQSSPPSEDTSQLARRTTPATPQPTESIQRNQRHSPTEPLRMPSPLNQLPWDLAKDQFGGKALISLGF